MWNVIAWFFSMCERSRDRELYADIHRGLYDEGFIFQISFYGTMSTPYDGKHVQARIELLSRDPFFPDQVRRLYKLFSCYSPDKEYTLFVVKGDQMLEVDPL